MNSAKIMSLNITLGSYKDVLNDIISIANTHGENSPQIDALLAVTR